jgi:VWFA-related protein
VLRRVFLLTIGSAALWGQLPPPPPSSEAPDFTSETREVTLHVSVLDRNDRLITDVPRSAFRVFENNLEQVIKVFRREDVPVSMCLLIDSSGSMRNRQETVNEAALALVRASNPEDEVCVISFADGVAFKARFTRDMSRLESAMEKIESRGGTAMRDAISEAIDYVKQASGHDKKVLVVLTDGNDNASTIGLAELVRRVRQSEVLIYLVGLLTEEDRGEARKAKRALEELAEISGGLHFFPETAGEMHEITPQIAHEIRNQYTLGYTPANEALDGGFRSLRVEVKGIGRHTVRHRPGYYANPAR